MVLSLNKFEFWRCLRGHFLYSIHWLGLRKAIVILIAVVLGALLLAGLYALFGDVVMPRLKKAIEDMFNYAG